MKKLTVYKQYELQEYKRIIDKYKEDEDFQKIFANTVEWIDFFKKRKMILKLEQLLLKKKKKNNKKK